MKSAMTRSGQTQQEIQPEEQQTDTPMSSSGVNPIYNFTPIKLESKFTDKWNVQPNEMFDRTIQKTKPTMVDAETKVTDDLTALQLLHQIEDIRDERNLVDNPKKKGKHRKAEFDSVSDRIKELNRKIQSEKGNIGVPNKLKYAEQGLASFVVDEANRLPYPMPLVSTASPLPPKTSKKWVKDEIDENY
jgi:hypothetical protein